MKSVSPDNPQTIPYSSLTPTPNAEPLDKIARVVGDQLDAIFHPKTPHHHHHHHLAKKGLPVKSHYSLRFPLHESASSPERKVHGNLALVRIKAGLSQRQLARFFHRCTSNISYFENGRGIPRDDELGKLCERYRLSEKDADIDGAVKALQDLIPNHSPSNCKPSKSKKYREILAEKIPFKKPVAESSGAAPPPSPRSATVPSHLQEKTSFGAEEGLLMLSSVAASFPPLPVEQMATDPPPPPPPPKLNDPPQEKTSLCKLRITRVELFFR